MQYIGKRSKFNHHNRRNDSRKEGEINIDYMPQKDKKFNKNDGEYVNYKDVTDD